MLSAIYVIKIKRRELFAIEAAKFNCIGCTGLLDPEWSSSINQKFGTHMVIKGILNYWASEASPSQTSLNYDFWFIHKYVKGQSSKTLICVHPQSLLKSVTISASGESWRKNNNKQTK